MPPDYRITEGRKRQGQAVVVTNQTVLVTLNYHNGPIEGISIDKSSVTYFAAPFRDDIDEYDDVYDLIDLSEEERGEITTLFTRVPVGDLARRQYAHQLEQRMASLRIASSPIIRRARATFTCETGTGGAYGRYRVEWDVVSS